MSEKEISPVSTTEVLVRISEITIGERFRKRFHRIPELAESIEQIGLLNPIIINENKALIAGGRRLEAFKYLGREFIPARVKNIEQTLYAEIDENNEREQFTISEKLAIAEALEESLGERRGRKPQDNDFEQDKNMKNSSCFPRQGETTREFVARKAGFGSFATLRQAKSVLSDAIPEVVDSMDNGLISINYAFKIAQAPKKKQLTLLNEANSDPATDATELNEATKSRRKAKRAVKLQKPTNHQADPIYSIVRLAPDWENELFDDIAETPIKDFLNPTCGVLIIECTNTTIPLALRLLEKWDLHYKAMITIYTKNGPEDVNLDYINKQSKHLIIGHVDPEIGPQSDWVDPVFDRQDLADGAAEVISKIWSDDSITRIDMSGIEPRDGWAIWKIDYADSDEENN